MATEEAPEEYVNGFLDAIQKMQILLKEAVLGEVGSEDTASMLSFLTNCNCARCKFTMDLIGHLEQQHYYYAKYEQLEPVCSEEEKQ